MDYFLDLNQFMLYAQIFQDMCSPTGIDGQ